MPYYEYRCAENGRTVEVRHGMDETMDSWGELCDRAGLDPGRTPPDAPVERLFSLPAPVPGSSKDVPFEGCGPSCACALDA